jgi:hypothetical protein
VVEKYAMEDNRRTDRETRKWFRSSRFFQQEGCWYFYTREGSMEGPFVLLDQAEERLAEYIKVMNSGFMPRDSKLALEPEPGLDLEPKEH